MATYRLSNPARTDLLEIWQYIASDSGNPDVADKVLDAIYENVELLAEMPGMGHLREDLTSEPLRFWSVYRYLIAYRGESPIEIVRVLHSARDLAAILEK